MKKLFLRDGKLWVGDFPEIPPISFSANKDAALMRSYNRSVESAVASAIEIIDTDPAALILNGFIHDDDDFYLPPEGWTVEYFLKGSKIANTHTEFEESHQPSSIKKFARLIKVSGIAATGVPEPDYTNFTPGAEKGAGDDYPVIERTESQKKYEEAAKYKNCFIKTPVRSYYADIDFLAGASFAEKDGWNAAIDKALEIVQRGSYSSSFHLAKEIEKLKL